MPKTKISEFDTNPANNTDINGINIAEGCAPSGINNAIRQLMSDLKEQQTGASGDNFTVGGNLAVTGTSAFTGNVTLSGSANTLSNAVISGGSVVGNLAFTGTGNRITGDFSNATVANRAMFQTSTANTYSSIGVLPSGTGTAAYLQLFNSASPANSSQAQLQVSSTEVSLASATSGTGTYLPMTFYTNGAEQLRIATTGRVTPQKSANGVISALTDAATITPDFDAANNFSVTLGGNRTLANPTNITPGQSGSIFISQDGTGNRTLAYGSYWDFANGAAPTLSTTANAVDRIDYIVRTSTSIHAVLTSNYS